MSGPAAAILVVVLWVGGALATGAALARPADANLSNVERLANALLLGAGALGLAHFLIGLVRLDRLTVTLIIATSYTPLLSVRVRCWIRNVVRCLVLGLNAPMIGVVAVLITVFVIAIPRPLGDILDDGIAYHLLGPAVWIRRGSISPVLDSSHTAFPALIESLFSAGMALSNDRFPGMLGVVFAAVLLAQVYGLARSLGATKADATLMSLLAACAPAIMSTAPLSFVDIPYASFSLGAVRLLLLETLAPPHAVMAGMMLGFALGTKYTGILLIAITGAVLLLAHVGRVPGRALSGRLAVVLATAALLGAPFYIKNAVMLGSPIYPPPKVLSSFFHASAFPVESVDSLESSLRRTYDGFGHSPVDFLLLPWRYTLYSKRFGWPGGVGAAPLALGVIGALVLVRRRRASLLLMWVALTAFAWMSTLQQSRFLLHVVGISFAFAALGSTWLKRESPRVGRACVTIVGIVSMAYGLGVIIHEGGARILAAFSPVAERELRERDVPYLDAWEYLNREPDVRRVLILEEFAPTYYLTKDYVKLLGQHGERPVPGIETTEKALEHLDDLRVTHVLDVVPPAWSGRAAFKIRPTHRVELVFESRNARIYEVVP